MNYYARTMLTTLSYCDNYLVSNNACIIQLSSLPQLQDVPKTGENGISIDLPQLGQLTINLRGNVFYFQYGCY